MSSNEMIRKAEAALFVDIECAECGRLMPLAAAQRMRFAYLCYHCFDMLSSRGRMLFRNDFQNIPKDDT